MARSKQQKRKMVGGKVHRRPVFLYRMRDTPIQSDADLERWQAAAKAELEARRIDVQLKLEYTLKRQQEEYENYLQQLEQAWLVFKAGEVEERAEEDKTL